MKEARVKAAPPLVVMRPDGSGLIVLTTAAPCRCGRMTFFVVNRDGQTLCVDCDTRRRPT